MAVDTNDPNWLALNLGLNGNTPGYNSNEAGSFERNYNALLNSLNPELLIQRYSHATAPQLQTAQDQAGYQAYSTFTSLFGRPPSSSELSQIMPAFQGPNGTVNGRAFLANLQQQYKMNPQIDPTSQVNNQNPQDIYGAVSQQFQSVLGRAPTQDELQHFSEAIRTNQTDAYGLGSFLKQMPEYTNAQDKAFRQSLSGELQGYDQDFFKKASGDVVSDYANRGIYNSPSLDYAITNIMGDLAKNRNQYLSNLSANQYQGNKDLATGNYKNILDSMYNQNQQQRQNQMAYNTQLLNRGFEGADYATQKNDYMNFLNNQPRRQGNSFFDYLNAGLNTANTGANLWRAGHGY